MAPRARHLSLFDPAILRPAIVDSFRKLAPQLVAKNPVMFVVEIGSVLTTAIWLRDVLAPSPNAAPTWFTLAVSIWLWFTVVFANFAEAVAEGRGKTCRASRTRTSSRPPA
jgi:K+-transporting ATPase ATPase B chain